MVVAPNASIVSLTNPPSRLESTRHGGLRARPHLISLLSRADQTHRGEQRPLRCARPPLRLPALPVVDARHPARHVRKQVLAP